MDKVGVVGPVKSVNRILQVAKQFSNNLKFVPFIYDTAIETTSIVSTHYNKVDYFLFSGPIPYDIAKKTGKDTSKFFYIHLLEAGFYKALLQILISAKEEIECLSIDIVNTSNIIDISLDQLSIPIKQMIVKEFDAHINYYELYEYHLNLYQKKQVDAVLTCYPEVMELLKKDHIPVEWISTTNLATRQVLELIEQRSQISYFKRTQIGVCMIDIDMKMYEELDPLLSSDIQIATLKMNEQLILLSREMNGSFISIGDGKYMIFSSRGEIFDHILSLSKTIHRLNRSSNREIKAGIGFGDSALKAELNARKAMYKSELENKDIVIIDDLGEIVEVPSEQIYFSTPVSNNSKLVEQLKDKNISIQSFEKIRDVVKRKKWKQFTSSDLALELDVSNRNAQRLLQSLKKANIIKQVGEEKIAQKGRPRLLYQMNKDYL